MLRSAPLFCGVVRCWSGVHFALRVAVMVWTAPYGIDCARMRLLRSQTKEPSVNQIIRIGMDTSKHFFQLHGVDTAEQPVLRRKLRRKEMVGFFAKLPPTVIGMEACGASHYWGRVLRELGHTVKLIAPQHVKPYIKRNKNDGRDAEGLCEAMSRPTMQFVPVKTEEQQAALMLAGLREQMVARRTQLSNMIRGYAAEFGITAAKGLDKIEPLLADISANQTLPVLARDLFMMHGREYAQLQAELKKIDARLVAWHRSNADSRRLAQIPGIGPIGATALVMKAPDPRLFPSGRHFAAWIGLTPKDHSTAGKTRLGTITRAGDERLRSVLVAGATAVIQQARRGRGHPSPWLLALLARKSSPKLAAIALANKIARIAWKLLVTGESYHAGAKSIVSAHAA
jgi:transposase